MTALYHDLDACLLCGSKDMEIVVPLAPMPIATPNFRVSEEERNSPAFTEGVPLDLVLCGECGHLQVGAVGNPQFQYTNYVYTTSLSLGLSEHFAGYAEEVVNRIRPAAGTLLVELGSNDGTLLRHFKDRGLKVLGVDPARNIAERATAAGLETIPDFFTDALSREIRAKYGPAGLVIANNMYANIEQLESFTLGVRNLLADDGVFVFETQYGADVVLKNLLDTVYHEHLSYFLIKPLQTFFARLGMELIDVLRVPTKGGSFRATVQLAGGPRKPSASVVEMIAEEARLGLHDKPFYQRFTAAIAEIRSQLHAIVAEERAKGKTVGGYGVSVGTSTLLAQFDMADKIDFLVDDDPNKESHLDGPGYSIPVVTSQALAERKPGAVVIFAWRYAEPIMSKNRAYVEAGGRFIVPLPSVTGR